MHNLYWKTSGQIYSLIEKPFKSEADLEKYLFDNQEILGGDIYIIHRQIRTGSREGIPDMLGVDQDSRICILELKNHEADEDILPQALSYAMWADTNPDSIKAIWLESADKPDDIEIDWDHLDIRVILIAPTFKNTVSRMADKIGYQIDLVEIRRYSFEDEEFLFVEYVTAEPQRKAITTKVKEDWDWERYQQQHGDEATEQFRSAVSAIAAMVDKYGWDLPHNINKSTTGFKLGNRVVFSVNWGGIYTWKIFMPLPPEAIEDYSAQNWRLKYYEKYRHAQFYPLNPSDPHIEELEPYFVTAYKYISGTR